MTEAPERAGTSGTSAPFDAQAARISVFQALLDARAKAGGGRLILEDHTRAPLSYDALIRAAFALGARLERLTTRGERVGLLLPSAAGAAVVFFALQAIGRVPAMLNFTAGAMNLKAACAAAGLRTILTSSQFIKAGNLGPLAEALSECAKLVQLEDLRKEIGAAEKLRALIGGVAPHALLKRPASPDDEAVVLFTSGSFGAPRGVVLSHANLVSNVRQCVAHIAFEPDWAFFNPLPVFHCFGLTGGMLLPLLSGHKAVLYPSPLHYDQIPALVRETGANILLATDTFAQHYARAAAADDFSGLRFAVLGAERVREETRRVYTEKFGVELLEGFGATEASPVIAVNQPGANRPGSVGRLLPGIEARLDAAPGLAGSRLSLKGPNIMRGYLDPGAAGGISSPEDGWHDTGDLVTRDAEGYLTICGRMKRFAKIGGEMVSLAAVEGYASACWPAGRHAAVALPCPRKGERVVLVTDQEDAEASALLMWARSSGAPEIAVPKKIVAVRELPALGSGKTDYGAVRRLAEDAVGDAKAA